MRMVLPTRTGSGQEQPMKLQIPVMSVTNRYPNTMIGQVMMMRKNTNRSSMEHGRLSCCALEIVRIPSLATLLHLR